MLTINDDSVQSSQGNDLCMSDGGDSDESQQRLFFTSELVQKSQSGVLNRGGVSGGC